MNCWRSGCCAPMPDPAAAYSLYGVVLAHGGQRIDHPATLTLDNVTVSGNETMGQSASGGGINGGATLTNSTVSGNRTEGYISPGGGGGGISATNFNPDFPDESAFC